MTKSELFAAFDSQISRTAIRQDFDGCADNEWAVVGKFCRIVPIASGWDVWLCNSRDPTAGLTPRKVTAILVGLADLLAPDHAPHAPGAAATWGAWHVLDGEAWTRRLTRDEILACLSILGIRRRKVVSDAWRAAARERLVALRPVGGAAVSADD
jgi:hypothetical protein